MKELTYLWQHHKAVIKCPENEADLREFAQWILAHKGEWIACDTETTGLDIFSADYKCRKVQFGVGLEAWVIDTDLYSDFSFINKLELKLIFQNASFDWSVLRRCFGVRIPFERIRDTKILAHLVDPRQPSEGGPGLSLEDLTRFYIDAKVADDVKASIGRIARDAGLTKADVFKLIDSWDEQYLLYAGMDVILTWGLYQIILPKVPTQSQKLIPFEHRVAEICSEIAYKGFKVDEEYLESLMARLEGEEAFWEAYAYEQWGLESVNSNREVSSILIEDGYTFTEKTLTGQYKVDQNALEKLSDQGSEMAAVVLEARGIRKKRSTWLRAFQENTDPDGRVHPFIHSLQARTGRMSVSGIPIQQLPSDDSIIRRVLIADEGESIISCDYKTQELRVLAALSGDENMINAFKHEEDLHQKTADASGVDRSVGKMVNFAYVYGSGPRNIAANAKISVEKAREVIEGFERSYPKVKQLNQKLQDQARKTGAVITPTGRVLPVDKDRPYSALNYLIQSTSRDITASALVRLADAGYLPYLRVPVHDEVISSVPTEEAQEYANQISATMAQNFQGLLIDTDAAVYGPSWGHGYMNEEDDPDEPSGSIKEDE